MKGRRFPVRGDHNLTPDPQPQSGVQLHEQVYSEGVASPSGRLSDSLSCDPSVGTSRRGPVVSPPRRLRFEDETEMEAESRYLERQRRQVGQRGTGVLMSKPHLNLYVNGMVGAGLKEAGHVNREQKGWTGGGVDLNLHPHPPVNCHKGWSLNRHRLHLRTEPIRETYIGSFTSGETGGGRGRAGCVSYMQVRRSANQVELNRMPVTLPQATPTPTDLPTNPYPPCCVAMPIQPTAIDPFTVGCPSFFSPPLVTSVTMPSVMMSQSGRPNGTKAGQDLNQNQEKQGRSTSGESHRDLQSGSDLKEEHPLSVEEGGLKAFSSYSSSSSSDTEQRQVPPTSGRSEQVIKPMREELPDDATSAPVHFGSRDNPSRLSLRQLFSTIRLSRTRTGSLDRLSSKPRPSIFDSAPSGTVKSSGLLKKCPSVQSLSVQGSPVLQLRKSSSVQSFGLEQKKKRDRSDDYRPATDQLVSGCLSVEDVGCPCSRRPLGRVLQVCSDGTFVLEFSRPAGQPFGFIISRGRGRPDSGVYVEDIVDCSTEKLYSGLLSVGDEVLEVNGEKVSGLSLDQVTQLLIQKPCATVRVLRHHSDHSTA